jgi:hypothetical protein
MSVHPRYWPTWLALGVLRVFEPLPFPLLVWLGRRVGEAIVLLPLGFVRIARRNLELCLPELAVAEREKILREHFRSLGVGVFETAISWWSSDERIRKLTRLEGEKHLEAALARGRGGLGRRDENVPGRLPCGYDPRERTGQAVSRRHGVEQDGRRGGPPGFRARDAQLEVDGRRTTARGQAGPPVGAMIAVRRYLASVASMPSVRDSLKHFARAARYAGLVSGPFACARMNVSCPK